MRQFKDLTPEQQRAVRMRRAKRIRQKKIMRIKLTICAVVLFALLVCSLFFIGNAISNKKEDTNIPPVEDIKDNNMDSKNDLEVEDTPTNAEIDEMEMEDEIDIRKIKNTATSESHKTNGLAVCMYHYVYTKDNVPETLNNNYIEQDALRAEFQYLVDNDYYFPTWEEVRQYVDGDLLLPEKSVVLTFDDAANNFLTLGIPIAEELGIPITSFIITSKNGDTAIDKYDSPYVTWQSHTHDMHRAGGSIGHGGIFTAMPFEDAVEDLLTSIEICGSSDALAYPYGDYNDSSVLAVEEAGFLCAFTTEYGRVYPGDNPYLLKRVRMLEGESLESFIVKVE